MNEEELLKKSWWCSGKCCRINTG